MPSINVSLSANGPLLSVLVGVSAPKSAAMQKAGLKVPQFVQGTFLLDTGASGTCVDPHFVQSLGLTPRGAVMIQTPSTAGNAVSCNQYDVALFIPGMNASATGFHIGALPVIETPLAAQGIEGLIGRDVIDRCTLVYNGSAGMFTLAF